MAYRAPMGEIDFALSSLAGADDLADLPRFAEATPEMRRAVLGEAARLCETAIAPLNAAADIEGVRLTSDGVHCPAGFREAYQLIAEGGWVGVSADPEHGGMGLPQTVATVVNEMASGACLALSLVPLLTLGQIEAIEAHADDRLKALFLPKLVSGRWTGTMNLTEAQAGSDLSQIRTVAEPQADGSYRLHGQKLYITFGDHDLAENISHLVLARLPDAPDGVRGLSLFLAPKRLPDAAGNPGAPNALRAIGIERKMGLHGSPTCVMAYEGATAWLVGEPNRGLAGMFTMMNNARLNVGVQGLGVGEAAFQAALAFARERRQGATPLGHGPIADHADVRRMLMTMRTRLDAARAIAYACAVAGDMARGGAGEAHAARCAFLTPIAKAFCTDVGCEVASLAQQVLGGAGYVHDYGVEQLARDIRIAPIYEGTNGIQAMDLVGRKLADGGAVALALIDEIAADAGLQGVAIPLRDTTRWMLDASSADRQAGAEPYLRAWALALGALYHRRAATADPGRSPRAAWFLAREAVQVAALCEAARDGSERLYALPLDRLGL